MKGPFKTTYRNYHLNNPHMDESDGMCSETYDNDSCFSRFCNPRKNRSLRDILRGLLVLIVLAIIVTVIFLVCYFLITDIERKETAVVKDLVSEFSSAGKNQPAPNKNFETANIGYISEDYIYEPNRAETTIRDPYPKKLSPLQEQPKHTEIPVRSPSGFVPVGFHNVPKEETIISLPQPKQSPNEFETYDIIEAPSGPVCEPLRLALCSDSMPWSLTAFPNMVNDTNDNQLRSSLVFFQSVFIESRCSLRSAEFTCALLEPPCGPDSIPLPPCRSFCQDISSTCSAIFAVEDPHIAAFDCSRYPDSQDPNVCVTVNGKIPAIATKPVIANEATENYVVLTTEGVPLEKLSKDLASPTPDEVYTVEISTPEYDYYEEEILICEHSMFLCEDGSDCLNAEAVCDGVQHCLDNTDELNCSKPDAEAGVDATFVPTTLSDPSETLSHTDATAPESPGTRKASLSEILSGSAMVASTTGSPRKKFSFLDLPDATGEDKKPLKKSLASILSNGDARGVGEASAPEPSFMFPPRRKPSEDHAGFLPTPQRSLSDILASVLPKNTAVAKR